MIELTISVLSGLNQITKTTSTRVLRLCGIREAFTRWLQIFLWLVVLLPGIAGCIMLIALFLGGQDIRLGEVPAWPLSVTWVLYSSAVVITLGLFTFFEEYRRFIRFWLPVLGIGLFALVAWVDRTGRSTAHAQRSFASIRSTITQDWLRSLRVNDGTAQPPLLVLVQDDSSKNTPQPNVSMAMIDLGSANSESEVRSVLYVVRKELLIRSYRPSGSDYQYVLDATLIDWSRRVIVGRHSVSGSAPEDRSGAPAGFDSRHYGSEPWSELRSWVASVVKRAPA